MYKLTVQHKNGNPFGFIEKCDEVYFTYISGDYKNPQYSIYFVDYLDLYYYIELNNILVEGVLSNGATTDIEA